MLLSLALVGCALVTKQKDFDVDVPLFEDAGEAVEPATLPFEMKLYDERTEWTLPAFLDVDTWGALLLADAIARRDLGRGFLQVTATELTLDAEPGFVTVRYTLVPDEGWGRYTLDAPTAASAPAACDLTIDEATTPEAHADGLRGCLEAWVDANGAPQKLSMTAAIVDTDLDDYALTVAVTMDTDRPADVVCTGRLGITEELLAESDNVDFTTLEIGGYAAVTDHGMDFVAFENTYDDSDSYDPSAGGTTAASIAAGGGAWIGTEVESHPDAPLPAGVSVDQTAPIAYFPGSNESWRQASVASLEDPDGYVEACWVGLHDGSPNPATVHITLVGDGHYDGRE